MSNQNTLANLKDIHMPPPISNWPPAPGWWFLIFFILLIIIFTFIFFWRRYKRLKPKNEALRILNCIQYEFGKNENALETLNGLSKLIRRTALTFFPRENVASLHGLDWLIFLDKSGDTKQFTQGVGSVFGEEIYMKNPKVNILSLFSIVRKWIIKITKKNKLT